MATIKIKRGTTDPTGSNVTFAGELAANTSTPKIFLKTIDDSVTTPVWVGATIEASPSDWTSATKLATQSAINTTFMPKGGGTFTGAVSFGQGSTAAGEIRLLEDTDDGSNYSAFRGSARSANITYVMPTTDPTGGQILSAGTPSSNVSQLSWADASSATTVTTNSDNTNTTRYIVLSSSAQSGATLYVDDTTTALSYNPSTADLTVSGDVNVNGGDLKTTSATASVFDTNATTLTVGAAATTGTFGYSSTAASTTNISTGVVAAATTKTVNIGTGGDVSSTTNVNIGSSNGGTVTINSDAVVSGNLTVNGTTTTVNSTTLSVTDPLIFLANNNSTTDAVDIGFYGLYDTSGSQDLYTGLFRDASDDKYKLFKSLQTAPTTTVNTGGTGYASATLVADLEGKVNGLTVSSSTGTLTVTNGKTLSVSNTLTFTGTDSSSVAFGTGGTVAYTSNNLGSFASTTSSQLAGVISDETGSGALVFGTSPAFTTSVTTGSTTFSAFNTTATTLNFGGAATALTMGATSGTTDIRTPTVYISNSTTAGTLSTKGAGSLTLATGGTSLSGTNASIVISPTGDGAGTVSVNGGDLYLGTKSTDGVTNTAVSIIFEGATDDTAETTLTVADPSTDRTITLPDATGTVITTGNLTGITATGTIASGTWNGTAIGAAYGGTGQTTYTTGDILYASGSSALSKLSSSATAGAVLASTGASSAPEYKTISLTNGSVTSGSGTLTLALQDAAADGTTKGIATFNASDFNSASGVITIDTVDGGSY